MHRWPESTGLILRGLIDFGSTSRYQSLVLVRLSKWLVVLALSLSIGAHWVVLQSAAWVGMAVSYSQESSLKEALVKTFDGKHPCALCKSIAQGRQSERTADFQLQLKKLEFLRDSTVLAVYPPADFRLLPEQSFPASLLSETPPVPPPRSLGA
jgi:hypothetical protein